jgi:uncharacterized LabA/DUF88 family protein
MKGFAYIDASNLFYGGRKSLGWSIDYQKLRSYLREKYHIERAYFFGGVEIHKFPFDYLTHDSVPIHDLEKYLTDLIHTQADTLSDAQLVLLDRHLRRVRFYKKLETFGYDLILKPVKTYVDDDGAVRRKANCDVDMAFHLMRDRDQFDQAVVLSGDGDFLPVLKFLRAQNKMVRIMARGPRTAKEVKQFAGDKFLDFTRLRHRLAMDEAGEE